MNTAALEARRAYKRAWAKNNPDKVRQHQERYWTKRAAERAARAKGDPDSVKEAEHDS